MLWQDQSVTNSLCLGVPVVCLQQQSQLITVVNKLLPTLLGMNFLG